MKNSYKIISVDNHQRRLGVMTLREKDNQLLVKVDMDPIHPGLFNQNFVFELLRKVEIAASTEEEKELVLEAIDHLQDHCRKLLTETRPPFRILRFIDCNTFMPMISVIGQEDNTIVTYSLKRVQDLEVTRSKEEAFEVFYKEIMNVTTNDMKDITSQALEFLKQHQE